MTCVRAGISRNAGVPNSAIASRNGIRPPARIAGRTSGRVMRQVVRSQPAPRIAAERSASAGTSSSALETKANV